MNHQIATMTATNGVASTHDLFALTDEQILEIEPRDSDDPAGVEQPFLPALSSEGAVPAHSDGKNIASQSGDRSVVSTQSPAADKLSQARVPTQPAEPPAWLAAQMKDPWSGEEARDLWEGVQRAQAEVAEYKQVFEKPEAARAAAERARALDEFDAAYFGAAGKSAEETSAARVALAQQMLREDPTAFREMVSAGVKALEELNVAPRFIGASSAPPPIQQMDAGLKPGATQPESAVNAEMAAHLAAYSEFEKAANQDLEKSVGATIERALQQALPNVGRGDSDGLKLRLATGVRQEIEKVLQGDRQLGEQVAQVLSSRRFDDSSRAQVVRLINERAQQLVPSATKRVLNDWTQTTLAAHRSKTEKQEAASRRTDLSPAQQGRTTTGSQQTSPGRSDAPPASRSRIDYKKLSDEQILEL
ncbi:MAG: hypothetical protein NVS9B14_12960 [Candidatus Acidiferrum sp.]